MFLGKIVPYFAVAAADLAMVLAVGVALFGVPFRGSYAVFALGAVLFLFVTLGIGVLISSVSENQGQAIQMAFMFTLPQVLLSGLIFPLASIAAGVRWIVLPAAADLLQRDLPRRHAPGGADRTPLAAAGVPGPARPGRDDSGHAALPQLPRPAGSGAGHGGRAGAPGAAGDPEPVPAAVRDPVSSPDGWGTRA